MKSVLFGILVGVSTSITLVFIIPLVGTYLMEIAELSHIQAAMVMVFSVVIMVVASVYHKTYVEK